jgi:hypothetical protein
MARSSTDNGIAPKLSSGLLEARFPREPLGVERPAFGIRGVRNNLAKERQPFDLLCNRDLQMMARHGFVTSRRAHPVLRCLADDAEIRVEPARTRPVQRRRVVIRAGRRERTRIRSLRVPFV